MKKVILILALMATSIGVAQVKTTTETDDFSGKQSITTDMWTGFGVTGVGKQVSASMSHTVGGFTSIMVLVTADLGCFSELRSKIEVKLSNGEILEFVQMSKTTCKSTNALLFLLASKEDVDSGSMQVVEQAIESNIEKLLNNDWEVIRLTGTRRYTDIKPKQSRRVDAPQEFFKQHLQAILNEVESLSNEKQ